MSTLVMHVACISTVCPLIEAHLWDQTTWTFTIDMLTSTNHTTALPPVH